MTKPGYSRIIVKTTVRNQLETLAKAQGFRTVNQLLEAWISQRVNPGVHPNAFNGGNTHQQTNPFQTPFMKSNANRWWAGSDLNRRPSARQADVLTMLDDRP